MLETTWEQIEGRVEIAPGVRVFARAVVNLVDYHGYDIRATVKYTGRRVEVTELTVFQRPGGEPVTGEGLRKVTVAAIVRSGVRTALQVTSNFPEGTQVTSLGLMTTEESARLRDLGPVRETLEAVAKVYKIADVIGDPPTKAVRETFNISQSTAGAWIGRARAAELIAPVDTSENINRNVELRAEPDRPLVEMRGDPVIVDGASTYRVWSSMSETYEDAEGKS